MSRSTEQIETLKGNDQWVCWGYYCRDRSGCGLELAADADTCPECGEDKTKPPIAPTDARRYAKSNDSTTWGSYEEAVAYHEREDTHTEGVGYMLSGQGVIVGLDLDGCRHPETGELEPWAEEVVERADSYTEVSPSGTGLRIFAVGILPDGRNKQKQDRTLDLPDWVEENKNSELEVYDDVRYMTYTGEQLEGTPDDVQKRASEIKDIHSDFVAQSSEDTQAGESSESRVSPDDVDIESDDSTSGFTNEFGTSLEKIRQWDDKLDKLLSRLEPAFPLPNDDNSPSGYDYSAVTKLLYWRFDDADIARILRKYRHRGKLDRDDYIRTTISNARSEVSEKCDPPKQRDVTETADVEETKLVLDSLLGMYEGREDPDIDRDHRQNIWDAVGQLEDDVDEYASRVAKLFGTTEQAVKRHTDLASHAEEYGDILVEEGSTWYIAGTPLRKFELLNFEIDVKSYLQVERGPMQANLNASLPTGETFEKEVEPKVFNKKERFDDEILGESFGTKFNVPQVGDSQIYVQDLLDALRMWVHRQDAPTRQGLRHMGVHDGEFVIPGATLGPEGWREDPDSVYLEREIGAERRVSMPTDKDQADTEQVAEIVESLPHTRDKERFLSVVGWFYAAPYRSMIDDLTEDGEFNHLNITGDTGSGKTASLSYLWRCFGMGGEPFSVDSSAFAQLATFSSTSSIPLWFDEYKPSDIQGYKLDRFHDKLRKANRGAFAERGNADKTTDSYKIEAPCVISGEQTIQGPAERRRSIMTQFKSETTDPNTETAERFKELVGMARMDDDGIHVGEDAPAPEEHALAYYQHVVDTDTASVRENWHSALEQAHRIVEDLGVVEDLDDLEIQGLQTVVFGFKMYRQFAETVGADMDKLPTEDDLRPALEHVVDRIGPEGKRKSHTDRFIELFGRAASADYVENGTHYTVVKEGKPNEELRINLPRSFDAISKYAKDHDVRSDDVLNNHNDYRDRFAELANQPDSFVRCVQQYSPPVSKCTGISTVEAMQELEFDRSVVADSPIESEDTGEDSSGDGGDGGPSADVTTDTGSQQAATDGGETEADIDDDTDSIYTVPEDASGPQANARRIAEFLDVRKPMHETTLRATLVEDTNKMGDDEFDAALRKAVKEGMVRDTPDGIESML